MASIVEKEEEVITTTMPLRAIPLRAKEVITDDEEGQQLATARIETIAGTEDPAKRNCCELALDIICSVSFFLMSIFFIAATSYLHPLSFYFPRLDVLLALGSICYIVPLSIEIYKRRSKGALDIVMTSLGVFGALLWFIASCFANHHIVVFSSAFIIGSLFLLAFITYDLVMVIVRRGDGGGMSVFTVVALSLAWLATLLYLSAAGILIALWNSYYNFGIQDLYTYASLFISGSVFYFLHAIFYTVGLFTKSCKITCSVERSVRD